MVGEAPAHNEATGRDLYASLIGWPPVGPPLSARGEAERERLVLEGRLVAMGARSIRPHPVSCWRGETDIARTSTSFDEVPVNSSLRAPRVLRKPASIQTYYGHLGRWRHARSRNTNE